MKNLTKSIEQISQALNKRIIDGQNIVSLQQSMEELKDSLPKQPIKSNLLTLTQLCLRCYDLSCRALQTNPRQLTPNLFEYILRLRLVACQLISIVFIQGSADSGLQQAVGKSLMTQEIVELLVVTTRMCFDSEGMKYAARAKPILQFVGVLMQKGCSLTGKLEFLYWINLVESARFQCEAEGFQILKFKDTLEKLNNIDLSEAPANELEYKEDYKKLIEAVVLDVCIKQLRKKSNVSCLLPYLSPEYRSLLQVLYMIGDQVPEYQTIQNLPGVSSDYYQLYIEARTRGFSGFNFQSLRDVVQRNWNAKGYFQIVCYGRNGCAAALTLWFRVYNDKQQSPFLQDALKCYAYIVNSQIANPTDELIELSVEVVRAVMGIKRGGTNDQMVLGAIKKTMRLYIQLTSKDYQHEGKVLDFYEKISMAVKKLGFYQQNRDLLKLTCLYLMLRKSPNFDEFYKQLCKVPNDKSQSKELIKVMYDCINSPDRKNQNVQKLIKSKSAFSYLLLAMNPELMLEVPLEHFLQFKDPFSCYCNLLSRNPTLEQYDKIARHIHTLIEKSNECEKVQQRRLRYIEGKFIELLKKTQEQNLGYELALVIFYCQILIVLKGKLPLKTLSLNHYYRLNLWLEAILSQQNLQSLDQLINMCSVMLLKALLRQLKKKNSSGVCKFEIGQFEYLSKAFQISMKWSQPVALNSIKYIMLQLGYFFLYNFFVQQYFFK